MPCRGLSSWIVCAISSLPVPDSPEISTDACVGAACSITRYTPRIPALLPMMRPKLPCSRSCRRSVAHFAQRLLPLDRLLQQDLQPLRIDRFAQVVVGAFLDRFNRALDGSLRGQQDQSDVGELILQRAQQVEPAHPRHDQI